MTAPLDFTRKVVAALHASYADRPWQGNSILRTLRLIMNYGRVELEMPGIAKNPVEGFESPPSSERDAARFRAGERELTLTVEFQEPAIRW